jgi:hypothetical protein
MQGQGGLNHGKTRGIGTAGTGINPCYRPGKIRAMPRSPIIRERTPGAPRLAPFETWEADNRFYDFNVWSERKRKEKLGYIHGNPVSLPGLFQDLQEEIAARGSIENRQPMVATGGDKVEMFGAVVSFESARHDLRVRSDWLRRM